MSETHIVLSALEGYEAVHELNWSLIKSDKIREGLGLCSHGLAVFFLKGTLKPFSSDSSI